MLREEKPQQIGFQVTNSNINSVIFSTTDHTNEDVFSIPFVNIGTFPILLTSQRCFNRKHEVTYIFTFY